MKTRIYLAAALMVCAAAPASHAQNAPFFGSTTLHEIELTLTQEEWDSMSPAQGQRRQGPMDIEFPEIKSMVSIDGKPYEVGLRFKGNSSYMSSARGFKRPFKIDLDQFVKTQAIDGQTKLNLNNNFSDRTQIREILAYEIFRKMGLPSPRTTALAKVTLNLGGEKKVAGALYTLAAAARLPAFSRSTVRRRRRPAPQARGRARRRITYLGDDWSRYDAEATTPRASPRSAEDKSPLHRLRQARARSPTTRRSRRRSAATWTEESFAKFIAATVVTSNGDNLILSMGHNFYIWLNPKTNKFQYLPWDLNMAFGGFPIGDAVKLSIKKPWSGQSKFLERFRWRFPR